MSDGYLLWLPDVIGPAVAALGLPPPIRYDGWETRARSTGGFAPGRPLGVFWHHTASSTDPASDASFMCYGADARPIANLLVDRTGRVWILAAGATNTNGAGGPVTMSRGVVPIDAANTTVVGMELANAGTGEAFPPAQVAAAFAASNAVNGYAGNRPDDVSTHQHYAPTRKIDPATAAAVGVTFPVSAVTSSGTWSLPDLAAECIAQAGTAPPDPPTPTPEVADMRLLLTRSNDGKPWVVRPDYSWRMAITEDLVALAANMPDTYNPDNQHLPAALLDAIPTTTLAGDWPWPWV